MPASTAEKPMKRRLSHRVQPEGMPLNEWQTLLRVQAGQEADFRLKSLSDGAILGEYEVANPDSKGIYRVAIRGKNPGDNYCSCPDFAVNTLGTCKHVEFVLHQVQRRRGAVKAFAFGYQEPWSEIFLRYGGVPELRLRLGTDCPPEVERAARKSFYPDGTLINADFLGKLLQAAEQADHELRFYPDARAWLAHRSDERRRHAALDRAFPKGALDPKLASILPGARLHPYQSEGTWFAARTGRAILADDMGLGKTIQAIAAMELLRRCAQVRRILVVTPASLKGQWQEEILRFSGKNALVVFGGRETRKAHWADEEPEIKIANYELLHRDVAAINAWGPDFVVLDEAQRIKNWATRAAMAVRRIDSPHLLVLTGTPLENRIDELHSLVQVVDRFLLGPLFAFRDRHAIHEGGSGSRVVGYRGLDDLAKTLQPILLRRTRSQVLKDLPARSTSTRRVHLTDEQRAFHTEDQETVNRIVHKWQRYHFLSEADQLRLTCALQRMRMVCDSTYLLDPKQDQGSKIAEIESILEEEFSDPGTKVVLFSAWLKAHELVQKMLERRGWGHVFLNGGVPSNQRQALVKTFREDPNCRVFLATDAGNSGLNLQCASVIINLDLPWNPAVLEQRIGRIHRMGQARPVRVYNIVAMNSIESAIERILAFKKGIFAGVLDGGAAEVRLDGTGLQRFMAEINSVQQEMSTQTAAVPAETSEAVEAAADPGDAPASQTSDENPAKVQAETDPAILSGAFAAGAQLLSDLGALAASARIEQDAAGNSSLRIPVPDPKVLARLNSLFAAFKGI